MNLKVNKNKLKNLIEIVNRITGKKGDLEILNFFRLKAENSTIQINATDLEISYQAKLKAEVAKTGEVLIPAKQFFAIISNFFEEEVELEVNNNTVIIKGRESFSSLPTLSHEDYPVNQNFNSDNFIEIDSVLFADFLIRVMAPLRTADIFKPEFDGVYLWLEHDLLKLVTTDTIRLAEVKLKSSFFKTNIKSKKTLIPKKIIQEYLSVKEKPRETKICFEEDQVVFDLGDQSLIAKVTAVEYPNYQQILPEIFSLICLVNRDEIDEKLKLNKIFVDQNKEIKLTITPKIKKIELYSKNDLLGESKNLIETEIKENTLMENENFNISINVDFFRDGLESVSTEKVLIGFNFSDQGSPKPILIKSPIDDDFLYVLMPL